MGSHPEGAEGLSDPSLLSIDPQPGGVDRWVFYHSQDHNRLLIRANGHFNAKLEYRIIDPLPADLDQWLLDHQRLHDDLGNLTHFTNSDLQSVDFQDPRQRQAWLEINQQEHATFATALGI